MRSQEVGVMPEKMFERYSKSPEARASMDAEIRKNFKIPDNRYFTVTMPPGPAGKVFLDTGRSRVVDTPKLSKSDVK